MKETSEVVSKAKKIIYSFINNTFNGSIKDKLTYENIPTFSIRDKKEEDSFIQNQLALSQKFLEEGNLEEARKHLLSVTSLVVKKEKNINFYFSFNDKKYFIEIYDDLNYPSFYFYEADNEQFKYSSDTKMASFGYGRIPIITDKFISFISYFEDFYLSVKEDIDYINQYNFIPNNEYSNKVKSLFSNFKFKLNKYEESNPYIYNDLDNKSYYKETNEYEMIYHEDQNTVFVHILDKEINNYKVFNCSHIINIDGNERLKHITPDYFMNNFNEDSPFILFDSFKGLNIKCEKSSMFKEHISNLYLF